MKDWNKVAVVAMVLLLCLSMIGQVTAIPVNSTGINSTGQSRDINTEKSDLPINKSMGWNVSKPADRLLKEFKEKYGQNWRVTWHREIDSPRLLGGFYYVGRSITNKDEAEVVSREFIEDNKDLLKINISELKLSRVYGDWNSFDPEYQQYYHNIPVEGGKVRVMISKEGRIEYLPNSFYPNISISAAPQISKEGAIELAKKNFTSTRSDVEASPVILPEVYITGYIEGSELKHFLTWKVTFHEKTIYVDAENGDILFEYGNLKNVTISGTITGEVYPVNNAGAATSPQPLARQRIWIYDGPRRVEPGQSQFPIYLLVKDVDGANPDYTLGHVEIRADIDGDGSYETFIEDVTYNLEITTQRYPGFYEFGDWHDTIMVDVVGIDENGYSYNLNSTGEVNFHIAIKSGSIFDPDADSYFKVNFASQSMPKLSGWYAGDTHYHSNYTDNTVEFGGPIEATVASGKAIGLDWVTITDHSFDLDSTKFSNLGTECNTYSDSRFKCIRGEEISAYLISKEVRV